MAMTEQEWLACNDPDAMLALLRGKASDRKLRLFAVAYWRLLDERRHEAVSIAQARGNALPIRSPPAQEREFDEAVESLADGEVPPFPVPPGADEDPFVLANCALESGCHGKWMWKQGPITHYEAEAALLREVFGPLPFRPVTNASTWRTANVTALARSIYGDRDFDRLPILADALEDAGCDNADILNHCRQPGEHVRGCWVVDVALGKE
jgi:hypothetical protein